MSVFLAPVGNDAPYVSSSGAPFNGALLNTYIAGSSTPAVTYTSSTGLVQNANPMTLNSAGYPTTASSQTQIWLTGGVTYKFVLTTALGAVIWTRDNLAGVGDVSATLDQWVSGPAPTFVSATSFTLVGDQTTNFTVGRRVKTTNSGGTVYSRISNSVFGALTAVTVVNDGAGVIDSGLSAVSYGLLSADNPSLPFIGGTLTIPFNAQTGTTYQLLASDNGKIITLTNAGAIAVTLPAPGTVKSGWWTKIKNIGVSVVTITRSGAETIFGPGLANAGATSFTLPYSGSTVGPYNVSGVTIHTDGTNWHILETSETHGEQLFATTGSMVIPAGVTGVWVDGAAQGGGSGGTANGATTASGGGGAGQSTVGQFFTVVPGSTAAITITTNSNAGASGNNNGTAGGSTAVTGAFTLTLAGGNFGAGASAGTAGPGGAGQVTGSQGGQGLNTTRLGGVGGGNQWASPQFAATLDAAGVSGNLYGGGACGAANNGAGATAGAAGGAGFLRIRW